MGVHEDMFEGSETPKRMMGVHEVTSEGLSRKEYIKEHVYCKFHKQARTLKDNRLACLGQPPVTEHEGVLWDWQLEEEKRRTNEKATHRLMGRAIAAVTGSRKVTKEVGSHFAFRCTSGLADGVGSDTLGWESPPKAYDVEDGQWESHTSQREGRVELEAVPRRGRRINGLEEWLTKIVLNEYSGIVEKWCEDMGAVELVEIAENINELLRAMPMLKPLERRRLLQGAQAMLQQKKEENN